MVYPSGIVWSGRWENGARVEAEAEAAGGGGGAAADGDKHAASAVVGA